ncbi:Unknown protein [Striga hermonthica]|uniref:Uncharacterized protein n=1 Tax=Striga hermonthica TaxID=68872 RepID=A0A9N7MPA6_STRHE|nr:Unknown protein [Striga hermonthica]
MNCCFTWSLLSYGEPNIPEIEIEEKKTSPVEESEGRLVEGDLEDDDDATPLIEEKSRELDKIWHENGDLSGKVKIEEVLESNDEKSSEADSFDLEKVNVDSLDSPPRSPWTRIEDREKEEDVDIIHELKVKQEKQQQEDDGDGDDDEQQAESSDSGSNRAESSSPDTSMADILPMLDERHPLLDEDAPRPVYGLASSDKSSVRSHDSDDEYETHDEAREEIEGGIDYPFCLTPISTRRQNNPFDLPNDNSCNDLGLPPIPGSAPSVLIQRHNPFDIPYDPNEEKPNLMGDGFKEEFSAFQPREAVFRRHKSFNNVGPLVFGSGRRDARMRPYFVPEGSILEESPSSSFRRQSSGLSESKVSLAPETESIVSVEDLEDKKLSVDQEIGKAFQGTPGDQEPISHQEKEDEEENRELEPISQTVNVSEHVGHQEKEDEEEENLELEPISEIVNVSEHVGHGSQSSDDEESSELDQDDSNYEGGEHVYRRESSSSSLSEVSERVFTEIESGKGFPVLDERRYGVAQEPGNLNQTSMESTNSGTLLADVPQWTLSILERTTIGRFSEGLMSDEHAMMGNEEDRETVRSQESDADAYERADEKAISMPSVDGNSYPFDDAREMHIPYSGHLDEVRVLLAGSTLQESVLIESSEEDVQVTQDLNILETDSHITTEEVDDIKDIDEELLSELDNVGDFSVNQWGLGSSEIEKRIDYSVEEIFAQDIKINNTRVAADIDLD